MVIQEAGEATESFRNPGLQLGAQAGGHEGRGPAGAEGGDEGPAVNQGRNREIAEGRTVHHVDGDAGRTGGSGDPRGEILLGMRHEAQRHAHPGLRGDGLGRLEDHDLGRRTREQPQPGREAFAFAGEPDPAAGEGVEGGEDVQVRSRPDYFRVFM